MEQAESKPRLINTRRGAVFALCFTAYVAAMSVRDVVWQPHYPRHWLLDLDQLVHYTDQLWHWHFSLPVWVVVGANLALYAALLWGGVLLYRAAQGKERALIAGWIAGFFVGLVQLLVAPPAASALEPVRALMMAAALVAALDIFLKMPAGGYSRVDNQTSQNASGLQLGG
jgi:hypothetical protein